MENANVSSIRTVILSGLHLYFLSPLFHDTVLPTNISLRLAAAISCMQIQIGYSIMSSILPYLKNFMAAFDQHPWQHESQELTPQSKKPQHPLTAKSLNRTKYETEWTKETFSPVLSFTRMHSPSKNMRLNTTPTVYEAHVISPVEPTRPESNEISTINDGDSQKMIIKKGIEWSVDYDRMSGTRSTTNILTSPMEIEPAAGAK